MMSFAFTTFLDIGLTIAFPVVTISLAIALVITCFKWKGSQNAKNHTGNPSKTTPTSSRILKVAYY